LVERRLIAFSPGSQQLRDFDARIACHVSKV
jgi:hypothetical protein